MTALRERITLFWFLIFPLFLLALLALIFANVGKTQDLTFEITVVNLDRGAIGGSNFGSLVAETFRGAERAGESRRRATLPAPRTRGGDVQAYLADEIRLSRSGSVPLSS